VAAAFGRWSGWKRWFGSRSERTAAKWLRSAGLRIIAQNLHIGGGELDLLALDGKTLVVVEVRSGQNSPLHELAATVNTAKQRTLTAAATAFLKQRRLLGTIHLRYDILALRWPGNAAEPEVLHLRGAFESTGQHQFWT
jgi:putative endonuclease